MRRHWGLTPSAPGEDRGMGRFPPAPRIQTPCLLRRRIAVDLAVEVGVAGEAEGIGIRGPEGETAAAFMTIEIVTHAVDRRRVDGGGNRMSGIAGTFDTLTRPGIFEMIVKYGKGKQESERLSARSRTGCHTNLRLQRMSHPRPSPPPRPLLDRFRAASRPRRISSRSPGSPRQPVLEL